MREWVQRRIESGEYASASDYVRDLIHRDQNTQARQLSVEDIRQTIEEGRAAGETSPAEDAFGRIEDKLRRLAGWVAGQRCEFTKLAEADLAEIALYIAADNPNAAWRFVGELRTHCRLLTEFLARNPLREQYGAGVRVAVHGRYLIFYAAADDHTVVIERILHGSRHLDWKV
jgi:putative addiction module CopG family antidote